jgi:hypothetical protein
MGRGHQGWRSVKWSRRGDSRERLCWTLYRSAPSFIFEFDVFLLERATSRYKCQFHHAHQTLMLFFVVFSVHPAPRGVGYGWSGGFALLYKSIGPKRMC